MREWSASSMQGLRLPAPEPSDWRPYHGRPKRGSSIPPERRKFVAWDGEGINVDGPGKPQHYVLFGCSVEPPLRAETQLHTFDLLDFILGVGSRHPGAFHVGYAFNYDANMVLRSLHRDTLARLHKEGGIYLRSPWRGKYYIQFRPSKWFSVTRFGESYDRQKNPYDKETVRIFDIFGFFQQSFEKAYTKLVGPVPDVVREGKALRGQFTDAAYVETYWRTEIEMVERLADTLRRLLYGAGLPITSWHGPGALASFTMRKQNVKQHMAVSPDSVREASRHGYAGGRFEMFRIGRTKGPVYSLDINSAYPHGIRQLPSLAGGRWVQSQGRPKRLARFGIYRVRLLPQRGDSFLERGIGPLFHRDKMGNISFPWVVDGWYWSPEVRNLLRLPPERYEIVEGWEFQAATKERPFLWVQDVYDTRQQWKSQGIAGEISLKLQLNSLYGKMAQRVGWDQEKRKAPQWHQLEWAGWVTSNTRAMLWNVMSRLPAKDIIAVETDGLYTTADPASVGISDNIGLGEWSVDVYDEILYVQSGMAWLRKGECIKGCNHETECNSHKPPCKECGCAWTCKRRGLDVRTFKLRECIDYLQTLQPGTAWPPYTGETTRFIGMGAALKSKAPFKVRHCLWETVERKIEPGKGGKRVHIPIQCDACENLLSAYDGAHDMSIRSLAYLDPQSRPHDIPWEGTEDPEYTWREYADSL